MEKTILLPKNRAAELGSTFPTVDQAFLLKNMILKQVNKANISKVPLAVTMAASVAYMQAFANYSSIESKGYTLKQEDRLYEPTGARVDGVGCLAYFVGKSKTTIKQTNTDKSVRWMDSFFKLGSTFPMVEKCKEKVNTEKTESGKTMQKRGKGESIEGDLGIKDRREDPHSACLVAPCISKGLPILTLAPVPETTFPKLYVPFIFAEYKRSTYSIEQAYHQIQMYCTFGIEFLALFGVTDFPVWGLVTAGTRGSIVMTWKSSKKEKESSDSATHQKVSFWF